ncbi:MAG: hypothetical protein WAZ77_14265 [Candidatus Nitrosopolaris sp.]
MTTGLPVIRQNGVVNNLRVEDSFTTGVFHIEVNIEVTVTSDEGAYNRASAGWLCIRNHGLDANYSDISSIHYTNRQIWFEERKNTTAVRNKNFT